MHILRPAQLKDLPALSALCLRSKAYWGYEATFMEACREALTLRPPDLEKSRIMAAWHEGNPIGVVDVSHDGRIGHLDKLFVDPPWIGRKVGKELFLWATDALRVLEVSVMRIEADPGALPFYCAKGARQIGEAPSEVIAGRQLPLLEITLAQ